MTVLPLAADRVTVKFRIRDGPPSLILMSLMLRVGVGSLSIIVPNPSPLAIAAPEGLDSDTLNVSSNSSSVSPNMGTETVLDASPGANAKRPEMGVKSAPAVASTPVVE